MQVVKNLINSEKAVVCGLLVVASSVLTALGYMTVADWQTYTRDLALIYVGGKSVTGAAGAIAGAMADKKVTKTEKVDVTTHEDGEATSKKGKGHGAA